MTIKKVAPSKSAAKSKLKSNMAVGRQVIKDLDKQIKKDNKLKK